MNSGARRHQVPTDRSSMDLPAALRALYSPRRVPLELTTPEFYLMRADSRRVRAGRFLVWPFPRAVAVLGMVMLVLGGAAYGVSSLLATTWEHDPGLQRVMESGLATSIEAAQTIDGVTVSLARGYADAHRIAVGYTIDAPLRLGGQIGAEPTGVHLRDRNGRRFSPSFSYGSADPLRLNGAAVLVFDTADQLERDVRSVQLTLTIDEVQGLGGSVEGPWEFEFELPVLPPRTAAAPLVRVGSIVADVQLVVAASETRVQVQVSDSSGKTWTAQRVELEVGGRTYTPAWLRCDSTQVCNLMGFPDIANVDIHDEWLVTVYGLREMQGDVEGRAVAGPWRVRLLPK